MEEKNMADLKIDKSLCIVCGVCVSICPDVFFFEADGTVGAKSGDGSAAAGVCPVGAIVE